MTSRLLSIEDFRAERRSNPRQPPGAGVWRISTKKPVLIGGDNSRVLRFTFSDGSVDRMGDTIDPNGWDIANFLRNPVALWAHDSSDLPVGRAGNVGPEAGALMGDIEFATAEIYPFAETVFQLYRGGFLNAVSVGFLPTEWSWVDEKEGRFGIDFKRQELLEISCVPVPANPNALGNAAAKGIDTAPLLEWAERLLDGEGRTVVPRTELERIRRAARVSVRGARRRDGEQWEVGAKRDLPVDAKASWDGPAAAERMLAAAGFNGDAPDPAKARRGFLVHDAAKPEEKGSYKLPFADLVDGELRAVKGGVDAAARRLQETDVPQDVRDRAQDIVDAYQKRFDEGGDDEGKRLRAPQRRATRKEKPMSAAARREIAAVVEQTVNALQQRGVRRRGAGRRRESEPLENIEHEGLDGVHDALDEAREHHEKAMGLHRDAMELHREAMECHRDAMDSLDEAKSLLDDMPPEDGGSGTQEGDARSAAERARREARRSARAA